MHMEAHEAATTSPLLVLLADSNIKAENSLICGGLRSPRKDSDIKFLLAKTDIFKFYFRF